MSNLRLPTLLLPLAACAAPKAPDAPEITAAALMEHVAQLADDSFGGRPSRMEGGQLAAAYVRGHFERVGLEPLGEGGFDLPLDDPALSPNVGAMVRGAGEGIYLVTAHYDHLEPAGEGDDRIYNGADDNASGTAAVLELARAFAPLAGELESSVAFVAFSAEELGLRGSRHFVAHPPFELERLRGVINLDMIGRGEEDLIFGEGAPDAPELAAAIERANDGAGEGRLRIRFGEHPEWLGASDHAPFMEAGIPTLYFGVEDHPDYHRVSDHTERVLPRLVERVTRLVQAALLDLATGAN